MTINKVAGNLNESLNNLKLFYDHSPDMFLSVSPKNGEILFCNKTLLKNLHYNLNEVIGHSVSKLYHPDSTKKANTAFQEFLKQDEIKNIEMSLITKKGEKIDVSLSLNAVKDNEGKILFVLFSWRDICDMILTKSILEIKIKELDCIRRISKLQSYRQLSDEDFLKQTVIALKDSWLNHKDSGIFIQYFDKIYQLGTTKKSYKDLSEEIIIKGTVLGKISFSLGKNDMEYIDYHKNILRDIRNILVDTLTSKQTDEFIKILESAVKSSNDSIAIASTEGEPIYLNNAFINTFGYTLEDTKKHGPISMFVKKDVGEDMFKSIMRGKSWKAETEIIHKDGQTIPVLIRADAIKNQNNEIIGLVGIHTDISEKLEREQKDKKRQKEALKIFDAIDEMVYVADPKTYKLLFTNAYLNEKLGNGSNLVGKICHQVLQGKDKPCSFCTNEKLFSNASDEPIVWEFQNLLDKRWYRCTDKKIHWFNGKEVRMEIASDITDAKLTNLKLSESEERFRLASAASDNGIWDWWVLENKVYFSDKWKAQVGYQPEEIEDKFENWANILHPDDRDRMLNAVQDFLDKPTDYFIEEFRLKHKDGSYRWISNRAAAVINKKGKVIRMFGAHTDITDKKQAEEALRKTDQMYRNLIQNAPDGIALIDYNGDYKFMSPNGIKLFGFTKEEILKMNTKDLTHPEDRAYKMQIIQSIIEDKTNDLSKIEYRLLDKNNEYIWIESTFSKTIDHEDQPAIVINFRDISERKEYEKKLLKAIRRAETANIHKNQFLANMSHEIRTPMNGVIGFADLLKTEDLSTENKNKFLQIIDNNAKQLLTLIDDIIDIAKIEADELKIVKSNFVVNDLLKDLQSLFTRIKSTKISKDVEFVLKLPDTINQIEIFTDQARLRQILSNLLGNALKFTDKGEIKFGYNIEEGFLNFFVEDSGRGIPKDKIDKIFERFQQTNFEDATVHGGTGLGLAICRGLVQVLGGQISVNSALGQGSRFNFSIPAEIKKSIRKFDEDFDINRAKKWLNDKTILLAEDDLNIQLYYKTVFEKYQIKLLIANDGQEAIDLFKKHPEISLILMDIRMPDVNGYEAGNQILKSNPNTIIIAQTAFVMPDEKEKCLGIGFKDYLTKPIKKEELIKKMLQYI